MKALERRIRALETRLPTRKSCSSLKAEINVMTRRERDLLRAYLEYVRDKGTPFGSHFDDLRAAAYTAISAARMRLSECGGSNSMS